MCRAICQEDGFKVCCHESERDFLFQEEEESDLELERRFPLGKSKRSISYHVHPRCDPTPT
jgi:hypothetical protein